MEYLAAEPVKGSSIAFSDKTIAKALANIYRKRVNVKTEIEPELFLETVRLFNLASATGISDAVDAGTAMPDDDFLQAIKTNNEVFSAFRVHKMQNDIAKLMTDDDGKLKSFSKFAKDVKPYTDHKNRAWLQTEFNTAVLRAHHAADWQQFEAEKDVLPNLEWMPSTSTHPGEDHRPFWGTILPIDHPFWNEHRPGDRWNCKCRLRNTDKEATAVPTGTKNDQPNRGLENNPGKDGKIFSGKHPYMPKNCGDCPFHKRRVLAWNANRIHCRDCKELKDCYKTEEIENKTKLKKYSIEEKQAIYNRPWEEQLETLVITKKGSLTRHVLKDKESMDYERVKNAGLLFAKNNEVIMMPEIHKKEPEFRKKLNLPETSNPDLCVNGFYIDVKSPFSTKQIVSSANDACKQGAIACITDDHCIIQSNDIPTYAAKIFSDKNYQFDDVWFCVDNNLTKIQRPKKK